MDFDTHPTTSQLQKVLREIFFKVKSFALVEVGNQKIKIASGYLEW